MKELERIMVVIDANEDFSDAPDGLPIELRKALRLVVDKQSTEIRLLSIGYEKYLSHSFSKLGYDYVKLRKQYLDRLSELMNRLVDNLRTQDFNISCEAGWGHPRYQLIVEKAAEFDADLLIQHCRAYGKIERHHLTNDSWQLVRHCPIPLLLVKDSEWGDPITVMAAVDPMHSHHKPLALDNLIIDSVTAICNQIGGQFHIVHAYGETARPFTAADKIKEEHTKAFNELVADYDIDEDKLHMVDETPVYALKSCGEELNIDIISMGAISRSRLSESLVGSTAERVLDYVKKDLLIFKPVEKH